MAPMAIAAAAQAVAGIAQTVSGFVQKSKAKKMARNNKRPVYNIPTEISDNSAVTDSRASRGLSGQAVDLYKKDSDRKITTSIDAILKGGGSVNNIADLYTATNDGVSRMALLDDEMRSRNVAAYVSQNNTSAEYKDKAWQINQYAPYADKAQAAAALSKMGTDNIWKGINTVGSAATNAITSGLFKKEGDEVGKIDTGGVPQSYQSSMMSNTPTRSQSLANRYIGLSMGPRNPGMASLDPIWDPEQQTYVDPQTGAPY